MVDHEQKEPCDVEEVDDMEEGNGIEKKIKKKEKQNVTLQRRWTRAQMKTRIRIEKSSILKMTAMMGNNNTFIKTLKKILHFERLVHFSYLEAFLGYLDVGLFGANELHTYL
ncbi:unnamed protein product [Lactuca saligna]|uniref:Uncharacterized protein n=1 Tax=Lactuca saligna TaxID=75948 RepID=A0AA35YVX8_LACSI|nr:unnamed protein product [Lactuca saligna]